MAFFSKERGENEASSSEAVCGREKEADLGVTGVDGIGVGEFGVADCSAEKGEPGIVAILNAEKWDNVSDVRS